LQLKRARATLLRLRAHQKPQFQTATPPVISSQRVGAKRRPMTGSAKQSISPREDDGLLRRFAPRNDVKIRDLAIPRRDAPELCMNHSPRKSEGAGNAGRSMRPQPRV
jgi:hypothetical protein